MDRECARILVDGEDVHRDRGNAPCRWGHSISVDTWDVGEVGVVTMMVWVVRGETKLDRNWYRNRKNRIQHRLRILTDYGETSGQICW